MQSEILAHQEKQGFPKELHEGGCQEVITSGHGTSKNLESSCGGESSNRKIKIKETDGSSSRKKEHGFSVLKRMALK